MDKLKEIWKEIEGYNGKYLVSNTGVVKSVDRYTNGVFHKGRVLRPEIKQGYEYVQLYDCPITKHFAIHRLVATAFIPNPKNKPCVNHKNGIRHDNRVENLEWCTVAENNLHAYRVLGKKGTSATPTWLRKLSDDQIEEIRNSSLSIKELCLLYNVSRSTIKRYKKGSIK